MNANNPRILVAGTETLAGAALAAEAACRGLPHTTLSTADTAGWTDRDAIDDALRAATPDIVFAVAGESGGIGLNRAHPARLMESNLAVVRNLLGAAAHARVPRLLYLASSCCYPRDAPQPLRPESLLAGPFEPTNAPYSAAKLAGILYCAAVRAEHGLGWFAAVPSTIYGPEDHFDPENAHVVSGLMVRMHAAKQAGAPRLSVWGTGRARRDFIHSRDLADACLFLADRWNPADGIVHVGPDADLSIAEVAAAVRDAVGYPGDLVFDSTKPDGAPLKRLDASPLRALGWSPRTPFPAGLRETYAAYLRRAAAVS